MIKCVRRMQHLSAMAANAALRVGFVWFMMVACPVIAGAGDIEKGKTFYRQSCGHCHGLDGKGDGEMGGYLIPPPTNLASHQTQSKSDSELNEVIMSGRSGTAMMGFEGAIEETQWNDLLAYLRSLKP